MSTPRHPLREEHSIPEFSTLLEQVLERDNMVRAYRRVNTAWTIAKIWNNINVRNRRGTEPYARWCER